MFAEAVRPEFFAELQERLGLQARGFYSLAVVVWLMIWQRLDGRGTLAAAVEQLGQGMLGDMVPPEKRVREERVSTHTGGYCRARQRLPQWCAEAVCDRIFASLMQTADTPEVLRRWFLLDGSSMRLPHTRSLVQKYPPTRNQHGQSHWPVIRLAMAHHLGTGLALRPCWGAMNGAAAVSEQGLAEELIRRLPPHSALLGDRNFGVFSVAWKAQQQGHDVLLRLTAARARKMVGQPLPPHGDYAVQWRPSRDDRRAHPELPPEAVIRGRGVVVPVEQSGKLLTLYLFTTVTELSPEQLAALYRRRWSIELDIRSLKRTLRLESINVKGCDLLAKELLLGTAAYNLVRSVAVAAARQASVEPRQLSFSRVQAVVMTALPRMASVTNAAQWEKQFDQVLRRAARCKLPNRSHPRSYPREVWPRGATFPKRKSTISREAK